jgi:hypothetical protein
MRDPASVASREELAAFVAELRGDLLDGESEWENPTLDRYLEALAGWLADLPGWFQNRGEDEPAEPNWGLLAHALFAAAVYE